MTDNIKAVLLKQVHAQCGPRQKGNCKGQANLKVCKNCTLGQKLLHLPK